MKHDKPLVEDEDYVVIEEHPAYKVTRGDKTGEFRRSMSAIKVYAPALSDDEVYLCRKCLSFTSTTTNGIHAHQQVHKNAERKADAVNDLTALRSIAFGLLPEKMQATLLMRARKIVGAS